MDPQDIINLFDSCWFNLEIFNKPSISSTSSNSETYPCQEIQKNHSVDSDTTISRLPSILVRSKSDQISSTGSLFPDSNSPNSVLFTPHLQTILSGKEKETSTQDESKQEDKELKKKTRGKSGKTKMAYSKSLSELEFEELKGFMDLGFVFSEEDKDSRLVEIIPGLQRLRKKEEVDNLDESSSSSSCSVARPYLSEAWDVFDRKNREIPLMNWKITDLNNDGDIKNNLKLWAHNVAATLIRC